MKPPPTDADFRRFTKAMKTIMGVKKADIQKELDEEKKRKRRSKPSVSPGAASSSTTAS